MAAPGLLPSGTVVTTPVQQVDIGPTILDLLGFDSPLGFRGRSQVARLRRAGGAATAERGQTADGVADDVGVVFAEAVLWGDQRECLRSGAYKLIVNLENDAVELYDVVADPGETTNLAAAEPDRVAALREQLVAERRHAAAGRDADRIELDAEMMRQLKALGYTQ
jgi:arylsulfatase A-like enzyme